MAPIKFEEKIKDKLEQRTIEPSADSWSKLSKRLDEDSSSKNPRLFWWIGIAAGVIIMLAISVQFFSGNSNENVMPQVVEEQESNENLDKLRLNSSIVEQPVELANESSRTDVVEEVEQQKDTKAMKTVVNKKPKLTEYIQLANTNKAIKEHDKFLEHPTKESPSITEEVSISKETVAGLLTELNSTSTEKDIDREVDSLLKLASRELFRNKLKEEGKRTVDARALLESVQDDMGQSFRTRVFEALKNSYDTVKTAVAERNN